MTLTTVQTQEENIENTTTDYHNIGTDYTFKRKIVWKNVAAFALLHIGAFYGIYLLPQAKILTLIFAFLKTYFAGGGVTGGAHRLFSHRSYKAKFGLRLYLVLLQTVSGQNSIYIWVRDHRLHHKYSDTDADPHNANRGFFFSHMGWLMSRKHPLVKEKGRTIDMSDLRADPIVMFQYRHYVILYLIFALFLPVYFPMFLWNESFINSLFICYFLSYVYLLHITWTVNSLAHIWGNKPYDKYIKAKENNFVSMVTAGEGWHNYHHVFPWDYRASELGNPYCVTTKCIDLAAKWGFAYDLKFVSDEHLLRRIQRTGNKTFGEKDLDRDRLATSIKG